MDRYIKDVLTGEYKWVSDDPALPPEPRRQPKNGGPTVVPDISEFRSPLDGRLIGSRSTLREHEKRHAARQCGELKTPQDFDNTPKRVEFEAKSETAMERAFKVAVEKAGL